MADRDGLEIACSSCGLTMEQSRMLASPQPAPHAMTDEQIKTLAERFKCVVTYSENSIECFNFLGFARALLSQVKEPAESLTCGEGQVKNAVVSREAQMIVLRRDENGTPTVWCDPEIVDLVDALNSGSLSTVASCSGHGTRPGIISLKDGRELIVFPDYDSARLAERVVINALAQQDAGAAQ